MKKFSLTAAIALSLVIVGASSHAGAQNADSGRKFVQVAYGYRVTPNITYITANNFEAKLDVIQPANVTTPNPTLIFIHGGGWTGGSKDSNMLTTLPYLEMGWTVVNVEYRLAKVSLAPAAVEDCRCALRWIYRNAKQYNFDLTKLVVTGQSAGAHLALTTGMLPASAGFDAECPGTEDLKVAAIISWYGITDVVDLLDGPNTRAYAVSWLGSSVDRFELARRLSPLTYVRPGLPPILSIQGDADPTVPYSHSVRLRDALNDAGVPNEHVTVPGGKHGNFGDAENQRIFGVIRGFLARNHITQGANPPTSSR